MGVYTAGSTVSKWKDQHNSWELASAGPSSGLGGPVVLRKENAINGKPAIYCNGEKNSYLYKNNVKGSQLFAPAAATIFMVQKQAGVDDKSTTFAWRNASGDNRFMIHAT
jgi:hypothetical protein